jgi:hypothetical protein
MNARTWKSVGIAVLAIICVALLLGVPAQYVAVLAVGYVGALLLKK